MPSFHLRISGIPKGPQTFLRNQHIPVHSVIRNGKRKPVTLTRTSHRYVCLSEAAGHAISQTVSHQPLDTEILYQASSCRIFAGQNGSVTGHSTITDNTRSQQLTVINQQQRQIVDLHSDAQFKYRLGKWQS